MVGFRGAKFVLLAGIALLTMSACSEEPEQATRSTLPEEVTTTAGEEDSTTSTSVSTSLTEIDIDGFEVKVENLFSLNEPTDVTSRSADQSLWFAERRGTVVRVDRSLLNLGSGRRASEADFYKPLNNAALDISSQVSTEFEDGLLGIAFSTNGNELYASYTSRAGKSVVSAFTMAGDVADPRSERVLIEVDQPFKNHNGGQIQLGPDGFLYIALGDGGGSDDPEQNGQDTQTLLGAILRIDPESPDSVPTSNPFAQSPDDGRPEIWLYGVRNPWRFSFDSATGDMWVADVGQNSFEEITYLRNTGGAAGKGANLGWPIVEGDNVRGGQSAPSNHTGPIFTYGNTSQSCSVVGGHVYRGDLLVWEEQDDEELRVASLEGGYVFGDYCNDSLSILSTEDGQVSTKRLDLSRSLDNLIAIGSIDNELYTLEQGGQVALLTTDSSPRQVTVLGPNQALPTQAVDADIAVLPGGASPTDN